MRVMITGSGGQLGRELLRQLDEGGSVLGKIPEYFQDTQRFYPEIDELNICDKAAVERGIKGFCPNVVIHCAAMTNVDGCEDVPEEAEQVNGKAVENIARACETVGAKLVQVSTDYVFAGDGQYPYREEAPCNPQSVYGRSKRLGEQNAMRCCSRTFVVRTAWLYGRYGLNFVKTILRKSRSGANLRVVNDQRGSPTNAEDLAHHILKLAATEQYGIYHCTGNGVCSWYEFAREIVSLSGTTCDISPCTSSEYPQKAKRPAYSVLSHEALRRAVGDDMRSWQDALRDFLQKMEGLT